MNLNYQSYGHGHPLLILHGLLGSSDNWHTLGKAFSEKFHVFAIDQRNHGRSPHSDSFNYPIMAEDIREFMEQHNLPSAYVIGHSMGGKTAMQFALTYPARVDKLVVVDMGPQEYPREHDTIFGALHSVDLQTVASRQEVDNLLAKKIPSTATRQFLMKNLARDESGAFRWKMNLDAIVKNYPDITTGIETQAIFNKPTLFVKSNRSGYVEENDVPLIKRLFPQAEIIGLDVGHWVHAEAPQEFLRIAMEFLTVASIK
ncbi:MAG: alpha/beta fold hydrolase [Ignavibacteriales bacterium]|nr:alpha/beta fold hydrolase [Ignavibacteriales bacterium]